MNIYSGHKHLISDIIGLESLAISGGNVVSPPASGGAVNVDFPTASALNGFLSTSARSDHRHDNIFSTAASGNLVLTNYNGIYDIGLKGTISNTTFDGTNTFNVRDGSFTIGNTSDPTRVAKFDTSLISSGTQRSYQLPDTNGVVVVSTLANDGSITSIGTPPPPTPKINTVLTTSTVTAGIATVFLSVEFEVGVNCPNNVTGFNIYWKEFDSQIWLNANYPYDQTNVSNTFPKAFSIPNLLPGKQYDFKVQAVNALTVTSLESSVQRIAAGIGTSKPSIPTGFTAQYLGAATVRFDWNQNTEPDIKEYRIYSSLTYPFTVDGNSVPIYIGQTNSATKVVSTANSGYYYKLFTVNYSDVYSDPQETRLSLPINPAKPVLSNIVLDTGIGTDSKSYIDISFTDSSTSSGYLAYVYSIMLGTDQSTEKIVYGTITPNYRFTDIIANATYTIKVAVVSELNIFSEWISAGDIKSAADLIPPAQVTGLSHTVLWDSVSLKWNKNTEPDMDRYELYAGTTSNFTPAPGNLKYSGIGNSALVSLGRGYSHWYIKLFAIDTSGNMSTVATDNLIFDVAPDAPTHNGSTITSAQLATSYTIDNLGNLLSFIKLTFTDTVRDNIFAYYEYRIYRTADTSSNALITSSPNAFYEFTVIPNVNYTINVRAVDVKGNRSVWADPADTISITSSKSTVPPSPPTSLTAVGNFASISLAWSNPTNKDIKSIKIFRNSTNNSGTATQIATVSATGYIDTTVTAGSTFYYWVKATNTSDLDSTLSLSASAASIQLLPTDLDTSARVDFIVKDVIFNFDHIDLPTAASTTLRWTTSGSSGIIFNGNLYSLSDGNITGADNSYIIATLNGGLTATLTRAKFGSSLPTLTSNQIIIALTTTTPTADTNNHVCYVRQSNSMAIEGAIIRDATITSAKIKEITADKIAAGSILSGSVIIGGTGSQTVSIVANKALISTRNYFMGPWSGSSVSYIEGDEVFHLGSTWGCILSHTSNSGNYPPTLPTTTNTYWTLRSSKGSDGLALTMLLTNEVYAVSTDAQGNNGTFNGSETSIHIYDGIFELVYDGVGTAAGTYTITATGSNITSGSISQDPTHIFAIAASASNMTADNASITFNVSGKNSAGGSFTLSKIQSFSKVKAGIAYDIVIESTNGDTFRVGQSKTTALIAHVFKNGVEVTDSIDASKFKWRRISYISNPSGDATWNSLYASGYKQISLTIDSIDNIATFHCDIIE